MKRLFRVVCAGIIFDIKNLINHRTAMWKNPPSGGFEIPAFDPTLPKGEGFYGPRKNQRRFRLWWR